MSRHTIEHLSAHEILDSRGNPTVEVVLALASGVKAVASVPSGASTGAREAVEKRDADPTRYDGLGVLQACDNVSKEILPALKGMDVTKQTEIDQRLIALDGTDNKSRLGANAILGVSLAALRAAAEVQHIQVYQWVRQIAGRQDQAFRVMTPLFNVINGGRHADTNINIQEYWIVPVVAVSASERIRMASEIFHALGKVIHQAGGDTDVGNEGGYAPDATSNIDPFEWIIAAIQQARYVPGGDVALGLDVGASTFAEGDGSTYHWSLDRLNLDATQMIDLYEHWMQKYPLKFLEDGLGENDQAGWRQLTERLGKRLTLIGDDLFCTNPAVVTQGIADGLANAVLIKPNQIGTFTETMQTVQLAQAHGYATIASHRSGETNDAIIVDIGIGLGTDYLKSGAPSRGERLAKHNRLMEIERELMTGGIHGS